MINDPYVNQIVDSKKIKLGNFWAEVPTQTVFLSHHTKWFKTARISSSAGHAHFEDRHVGHNYHEIKIVLLSKQR